MAVIASKTSAGPQGPTVRESGDSRPRKALTIGAVAKILGQEFDDISISKIRYLEDQKLLAPRRTAGGYRLYSQADVERLRAILRMQRDEFLPLRVIRQELATGDFTGRRPSDESQKRRAASVGETVTTFSREDLLARGRRRRAVPARAAGVRDRRRQAPRRPRRLRRDRPGDRPRGRGALEVRRRRAQPAGVQDLRRSRGGAARAAAQRSAALAQPGAPQGGGREPREPRRRLRPPQAPAPGPRPAPPQVHRRVVELTPCRAYREAG